MFLNQPVYQQRDIRLFLPQTVRFQMKSEKKRIMQALDLEEEEWDQFANGIAQLAAQRERKPKDFKLFQVGPGKSMLINHHFRCLPSSRIATHPAIDRTNINSVWKVVASCFLNKHSPCSHGEASQHSKLEDFQWDQTRSQGFQTGITSRITGSLNNRARPDYRPVILPAMTFLVVWSRHGCVTQAPNNNSKETLL